MVRACSRSISDVPGPLRFPSRTEVATPVDIKPLLGLGGVLIAAMVSEFNDQVTSIALVDVRGGLGSGMELDPIDGCAGLESAGFAGAQFVVPREEFADGVGLEHRAVGSGIQVGNVGGDIEPEQQNDREAEEQA